MQHRKASKTTPASKTPTRSSLTWAGGPTTGPYDLGFSHGICVALQVLRADGYARLWAELLALAEARRVLEFVLLHVPEEWGLGGFADYLFEKGDELGVFTAWFDPSVAPVVPGWYNYVGFGRGDEDMLYYNGSEWGEFETKSSEGDDSTARRVNWVPYSTMVTDRWRGLYLGGLPAREVKRLS